MNNEGKKMNSDPRKELYHYTPLKILSFFSLRPGEIFSAKEISEQTNYSKGATNQSLRLLSSMEIIFREKKGSLFLYRLNINNIVLIQFKMFETLMGIQKLTRSIQSYCYQIILFGSCAAGANCIESDIDLFIKTDEKKLVQKVITRFNRNIPHLKVAIYDPLEILEAQKVDKAFFTQVKKGITLWEGRPNHERL